MQCQAMGEAVPSHGLAPCVEEEVIVAGDRADREPVPESRAGLQPQWQHALAPPLSGYAHGIEVRAGEVGAHQPDQFRDSEAGSVGQMQHRPVTHAGGSGRVRRIEQDPQLLTVERFDHRFIAALHRNRVHLAREVETGRCAILEVAEE